MSPRLSLSLHALALVLAASAAWWVYAEQPGSEAPGRVLLDWRAEDLQKLSFSMRPQRRLELERRPEPGGLWIAIEDDKKPLKKTAPDTADEGPEDKDSTTGPVRERVAYRASQEFEAGLEKILPLRAVRDLGRVGQDKLEEFGLDKPAGWLRLESKKGRFAYRIGKRIYGGESVYLQQEEDERVFMLSTSVLNLLDFRAPRYLERRLLDLAEDQVDRIEIVCGPRGARILIAKRDEERSGFLWAPADEPEASDEIYRAWVNRLLRLRATSYLELVRKPEKKSSCRIRFSRQGEPVEDLSLGWNGLSENRKDAVARSRFTGAWVSLDAFHADNLIDDLPRLLSGS